MFPRRGNKINFYPFYERMSSKKTKINFMPPYGRHYLQDSPLNAHSMILMVLALRSSVKTNPLSYYVHWEGIRKDKEESPEGGRYPEASKMLAPIGASGYSSLSFRTLFPLQPSSLHFLDVYYVTTKVEEETVHSFTRYPSTSYSIHYILGVWRDKEGQPFLSPLWSSY